MKKTLAEILGLAGASYLMYKLWEWTGKALYNFLTYDLIIKSFGNYTWFNPEEYKRAFQTRVE